MSDGLKFNRSNEPLSNIQYRHEFTLDARIEYLSRAVMCAKSCNLTTSASKEGEFLHELEEKMEVGYRSDQDTMWFGTYHIPPLQFHLCLNCMLFLSEMLLCGIPIKLSSLVLGQRIKVPHHNFAYYSIVCIHSLWALHCAL